MHSRYMYYFKRVAEIKNLSRAAEELYISQSQLSRIMSDIESEVGTELFIRDKHGINLNESGRVFYHYAVKSLSYYDEGMIRAREAHDVGRVHLCIGTNVDSYMTDLAMRLLGETPQIRLTQRTAPRKNLFSMLRNATVDCVLVVPPFDEQKVQSEVVYTERPVVVYPEGHWLAGKESVSIEALASETHVSISEGYGLRDALAAGFQQYDVPFDSVAVETPDTRSVARYVALGVGIAVLPRSFVVRDDYCRSHFTELEEEVTYDVALSWSYEHVFRQADEDATAVIKQYFAALDVDG